jgi:hypothetical protein
MGQLAPDVVPLFRMVYEPQDLMWLPIFFSPSEPSQAAGRRFLERIRAHTRTASPGGASAFDQREFLLLLGALGAMVAVAYVATKN